MNHIQGACGRPNPPISLVDKDTGLQYHLCRSCQSYQDTSCFSATLSSGLKHSRYCRKCCQDKVRASRLRKKQEHQGDASSSSCSSESDTQSGSVAKRRPGLNKNITLDRLTRKFKRFCSLCLHFACAPPKKVLVDEWEMRKILEFWEDKSAISGQPLSTNTTNLTFFLFYFPDGALPEIIYPLHILPVTKKECQTFEMKQLSLSNEFKTVLGEEVKSRIEARLGDLRNKWGQSDRHERLA